MCAIDIGTFYAYNAWANARVLDAAANLDQAQVLAGGSGGYGSIRDTLVHIVAAEWMYLERWRGRSPREDWQPAAFPDVAAIRSRWEPVAAETASFVGGLREGDLGRTISYVNVQGETWSYPLWQQMLHQVNHATQHRSEVAMQLTQLGHSPGWLDFLIFIDEREDRGSG